MPFMTSILDCTSDVPGCIDVICCLPCNIGRQYGAVSGHEDQLQCFPCILAMLPTAICVAVNVRRAVVVKYALEESCISSALCGCILFSCSVCQTSRELNLRGARTGHSLCAPTSSEMKSTA